MSQTTHRSPRFAGLRAQAPQRDWCLHVLSSPDVFQVGRLVNLPSARSIIGRVQEGGGGEIIVNDPAMSRRHALIGGGPAADTLTVLDLGSRNGTFVDGRPTPAAAEGAASDEGVICVATTGAVLRTGDSIFVVDGAIDRDEDAPDSAVPGASSVAVTMRAALRRAATDLAPVLLHGETGTGKERAAATIHRLSARKGALVRVNVAAIPSGLFESEFFGHARGAFSGASAKRLGRVREADGGTLIIDEIGELAMDLQVKLLRVLEEGLVRPVGQDRDVAVVVKFVASTNADLDRRVTEGSFRRDLLARLRHHTVRLPPLRLRRADLADLADAVLPRQDPAGRAQRWFDVLEPDAAEALLLHDWPDNLRGLLRVLDGLPRDEAALVPLTALPAEVLQTLSELTGPAPTEDRPAAAPPKPAQTRAGRPDRPALLAEIEACEGNLEAVARRLGRDRRQVYRWLRAAGISMEEVERSRGRR